MQTAKIIDWLLAGDAAIAWQTERDLLRLPKPRYERTRRRVAETGWGAKLLARRASDGTWAGGLYNPKWTSTFYTLQLLGLLGVGSEQPAALASCRLLLERGVEDNGAVRLWAGPAPDTCVTGMLLSMAIGFGLSADERAQRMLAWLLGEQMQDGGWNCRLRHGATHGSFHTTNSVLEALAAWQRGVSASDPHVARAVARGHAFMLAHQLYRSHRTGRVARAEFTRLSFPHWWKFDVLRGLDQFRAAQAGWDARLADPLRLVESRRGNDGRWKLPSAHPGRVWFSLEQAGAPSRWNTLRAMRVLDWAERAQR
jgi:hypothetical protein